MAGVLDIGGVSVARPGAFAATVEFAPGDTVETTIHYNNETGSTQYRDILVGIGTYNPDTQRFSEGAYLIEEDGIFVAGIDYDYITTAWHMPDIAEGTYDVSLWLGVYDPSTGTFSIYSKIETMTKANYLKIVTAKRYVEVTDFRFSYA